MGKIKVGSKVIVSPSNDNDGYDDFREKILIVTDAQAGGRGYDESMYPEKLLNLETQEGERVPFSLYEYEVEKV